MSAYPPLAVGRTNANLELRRRACRLSIAAAILLHLLAVREVPLLLVSDLRPGNRTATPVRPRARLRPRRRKPMAFVMVDTRLPDERIRPADADAVAAISSRAREPAPDRNLPAGPPASKGMLALPPSLPPARPGAKRSSPPRQRSRQAKRRPLLRQQPPQPPQRMRLLRRRETRAAIALGTRAPAPAPTTGAIRQRPRVREPVFKPIRRTRPGSMSQLDRRSRTRAVLAGTRAMALLKARYPEYMAKVLKLWIEAVNRQESLIHSSFRNGSIVVRVAIEADGAIGGLRLLYAPANMPAERNLALASIRDAAPFPPLTGRMRQDPLFKAITFILIFR